MATFTNQASLSYNNSIINSNIVTGEILEVIKADKTAVKTTYTIGETVTYVINIINSGSSAITGLTITDNLGKYTVADITNVPLTYEEDTLSYFADGVIQPAPAVTSTNPLTVTGINVPAQGNASIIYAATVNDFANPTAGGEITNTATVTGGGVSTSLNVSETITASEEPELAVLKQITPDTVTENAELTYIFTITNSGNTEASGDVILSDNFNPILTNITVSYNDTVWTESTNYSYDETTGAFATLPGQITVPAAVSEQNPETGTWTTTPGTAIIKITGTV